MDYFEQIKSEVTERLTRMPDTDDAEVLRIIDRCIYESSDRGGLSIKERGELKKRLFDSLRRLDILSEYLDDENVTEIMVNGPEEIYVERDGQLNRVSKHFDNPAILDNLIQQIVSGVNRRVNEASPIVDARLYDGSRVNVVLKPIALDGPVMTIRKFSKKHLNMESLIENHTITPELAKFFEMLVVSRANIFISGGTNSGKTTLLNCLSEYIGEDERIVTIEDSAELLINTNNLIRLETRNADVEGVKSVSIRDLIRASLRMRPDRVIVGEVRGGEALDLLQAMNTGHDGSVSTGHANSPADMVRRLETMCLFSGIDIPLVAIRAQIASAIDVIIQVERGRDGRRRVVSVSEVLGIVDGDVCLCEIYDEGEGVKALHERCKKKLENAGFNWSG